MRSSRSTLAARSSRSRRTATATISCCRKKPGHTGWWMKWCSPGRKSPAWSKRPPAWPIKRNSRVARPTNITLCSFCGKSHAEVKKLIAGPGVYICDNCVVLCKNVLDKELATATRKHRSRINVPKPAEIKQQLDKFCIGQEHAKKTLAVAVHNHFKRIQPEPVTENEEAPKSPPTKHADV